jgi:hypothetical protein
MSNNEILWGVNLELQAFLNSALDAEDWSAYLSDSISHSERDYGKFGKVPVYVPQAGRRRGMKRKSSGLRGKQHRT